MVAAAAHADRSGAANPPLGAYPKLNLGTTTAGTALSAWYLPGQRVLEDATAGTAHLVSAFDYFEQTYGPYNFGPEAGTVEVDWGSAPVNAPRSCPKNVDSASPAGIAAHSTASGGATRSWMPIALLTTLACGEPEDRSTEAGECLDAAAVEGAAELAYTELSVDLDDDWFSESLVEVLTQVLVAGVSIGSTCGAHTWVVRVLDLDGAAYLEVEVRDLPARQRAGPMDMYTPPCQPTSVGAPVIHI